MAGGYSELRNELVSAANGVDYAYRDTGGDEGVPFTDNYEHRTISGGVGHNLPQEAPQAFAQAVIDAGRY